MSDRPANRLADQPSAYLRQHAHNPVDWYPWGDDAIRKARREEKPIFLSVGYSSCHWCHVMEQKVFEDERIAELLNDHFVSIKVDREERPDLDRMYMEAVQALTRSGGWPMSVWLTPELKPFFGGTYFPPDTFADLCSKLAAAWQQNRDQIEDTAGQLDRFIRSNPLGGHPETFSATDIREAGKAALQRIDRVYGGFEGSVKFPTPPRWLFLLHLYRRDGDLQVAKAVRDALIAMASGGLQDHVGGGFHRYTVDASWTVPHFEKMLYDNAQLATLYLEAAAVFDEKAVFGHVARRTLDFLLREMHDADLGGFFGSWDADSGGEEGSFYVWTADELRALIPEHDQHPLFLLLGVTDEGNFDHHTTVLTRRFPPEEVATRTGRPVEEMKTLVETYRDTLYQARERRTRPGLDRKLVTSWNGLALSAMAKGYRVFGDPRYREAAEKTAARLRDLHRRPDGSLWRSSTDGNPSGEGVLDDYAFLAHGLLDLFSATGAVEHLDWAAELEERLMAQFSCDDGGFYHTPLNGDAPLGRQVEIFDSVEPSGNAMALSLRLRMASIQGDDDRLRDVTRDIEAYAELIKKAGLEMAAWLDAALLLHGPAYELVIAGLDGTGPAERTDASDETSPSLLDVANASLPPYVELIPVAGKEAGLDLFRLSPITEDKTAGEDDGEVAYLCRFGSCNTPTSNPDVLRKQLGETWQR